MISSSLDGGLTVLSVQQQSSKRCRQKRQGNVRGALQIERPDLLGHIVDEHADSRRQMFAAEIARVMAAIIRRMLSKTRLQATFTQ